MKNRELKYIWVAVGCALILVISHLLLYKQLIEQEWVEYTLAIIPFALAAIGYWSVKNAIRAEVEGSKNNVK
ncbi:hypothetical protein [Vibrio marisflavi]|uniref:Uncharacterized protein n=1 Tax=Vibrio marisflavi CECT 7928 TaxID=634439 RepID=A0ABN8E052_9VIBR|nr:hypothetical protein [Vibrio marisflavi]CAH0536072.1 hypothetical protein VMF7928_00168 [Vibrio marisflavi CECT 7928]